jgi:CMP-N-acetylneuraminic acid synthetase
MTRIAIIPARGGSKRLPRKNVRPFKGKPMLVHPIDKARESGLFNLIVVSTDDREIEDAALAAGATVLRRDKDDGSKGTQEVARDVLLNINADEACVIYPCSPLLVAADLVRGHAVLQKPGALFAMSVGSNPLQDAGCFYWGKAEAFYVRAPLIDSHTVMVPMPANRVCDINVPADWARAEQLYEALRRAPIEA